MLRRRLLTPVLVSTALMVTGAHLPAMAQDIPDTGGRVFGLVGGAFGDGESTILTSAGAGLRISRHLGLDFEVLYADDLGLPPTPDFVIQTLGADFAPVERLEASRLVSFLTKMTVEFPVANGRVWPYVTGGGGIGSLRHTISFRNLPLPRIGELVPAIFPSPGFTISATDLALTLGGGVDVRLWRGFAVGADVRYLRLLDDREGFDFAFVTSRVSYRF